MTVARRFFLFVPAWRDQQLGNVPCGLCATLRVASQSRRPQSGNAMRTMAFTLSSVIAGMAGAIFASMIKLHQPGVLSLPAVHTVPAGGDHRRHRGRCWGLWSAPSSWCCCPNSCPPWRSTGCCSWACYWLGVLLVAPRGIVGEIERRVQRKSDARAVLAIRAGSMCAAFPRPASAQGAGCSQVDRP